MSFLQTGQRIVQESYDAEVQIFVTANATGAGTIIQAGLARIRDFIHSDMITDSFLSDVLAHIGTLRDLLGRVKKLYREGHPTYKRLEEFDKRCDNMSAWLGEWLTIRAEISTDPHPPRAGAKRKTGRGSATDTQKRGRGGALESLRGLYDDIEAKMRSVYEGLKKSGENGGCLTLVQQARRLWPGYVTYFKQGIRRNIANILERARKLLSEGTPIRLQISEIIQLLVPPRFQTLCNDIVELWDDISDENGPVIDEVQLEKVSECVEEWENALNGETGFISVQTAKKIFDVLLNVVQTLQIQPQMKNNTRLQYIVKFISDFTTDLERRTSDLLYVQATMAKYGPPYASTHDIGTVAEEVEEETRHRLYLKLNRVHHKLEKSGMYGECLLLIQQAIQVWPGAVKFFTQDKRRDIAAILNQAQETLGAEGTGIWQTIEEIIQLLVPPGTVAEAAADHGGGTQSLNSIWEKGGPWDRVEKIPQKADITTLLRQMRQLNTHPFEAV
jgi:hypothetical protein